MNGAAGQIIAGEGVLGSACAERGGKEAGGGCRGGFWWWWREVYGALVCGRNSLYPENDVCINCFCAGLRSIRATTLLVSSLSRARFPQGAPAFDTRSNARARARASLCARARVCADGLAARGARAQDARNARRARAACAADFAAVIWSSFSSSCNPGYPLSCMSLLSENRHALALRRVDALPGGTASNTPCASTCGLVAMTSAQHAEGHRFNPVQVYVLTLAARV